MQMRTAGFFWLASNERGLSAGTTFEKTRYLINSSFITLIVANPSYLKFVAYLYHLLAIH